MQPTASDGHSQIDMEKSELSFDYDSITIVPPRILLTEPMERSATNYVEIEESHQMLRRQMRGAESTCNDEDSEHKQAQQRFIGTSDDAPFTDSGYSSLRNNLNHHLTIPSPLEKSQRPADTEQSVSMNPIDRDDAKTSYSAATTVGPVHAQHYIAELCGDIYGNLRQCFSKNHWSTLSKALPVLIKAFAVKIGYDSSAQVNQDIMYFLHRRHG